MIVDLTKNVSSLKKLISFQKFEYFSLKNFFENFCFVLFFYPGLKHLETLQKRCQENFIVYAV